MFVFIFVLYSSNTLLRNLG